MKLNRQLQHQVLTQLTEAFPNQPDNGFLKSLREQYGQLETDGNLMYLQMHGLIDMEVTYFLAGNYSLHNLRPTEKAFDFLTDDGGLSAVLGVVTVKLHADTIRELLSAKIQMASIPEQQKQTLLQTIKTLPEEGLKHLTTKLIDYALDHTPDFGRLLGL